MNTCKQLQMYINDIIDGTASDEVRESFFEHIGSCAACKCKYEIAIRIREVLTMRAAEADPEFAGDVMRAVRRLSRRQAQTDAARRKYTLRNMIICACALTIAVISVAFMYFSGADEQASDPDGNLIQNTDCRVISAEDASEYVINDFFEDLPGLDAENINVDSLTEALTDSGFAAGTGGYGYIVLVKTSDTDILNRNYDIKYIRSSNTGTYSFYTCAESADFVFSALSPAEELCVIRDDGAPSGAGLIVARLVSEVS